MWEKGISFSSFFVSLLKCKEVANFFWVLSYLTAVEVFCFGKIIYGRDQRQFVLFSIRFVL